VNDPGEILLDELQRELDRQGHIEAQYSARSIGLVVVATLIVTLAIGLRPTNSVFPLILVALYLITVVFSVPAIAGKEMAGSTGTDHAQRRHASRELGRNLPVEEVIGDLLVQKLVAINSNKDRQQDSYDRYRMEYLLVLASAVATAVYLARK
jgi:hypothetical protein